LKIQSFGNTFFRFISKKTSVLFDPAIDVTSMIQKHQFRLSDLDSLKCASAIFISHSHKDHFHLPTLWFADRNIPVYLPDEGKDCQFSMAGQLRDFGFQNINHIQRDEEIDIEDIRIKAIAAPPSLEGIAQTAFLIEIDGLTFLNGVDSLENECFIQELANGCTVDIVALPINCGFMLDNIRNQMSPAAALNAVRRLRPKIFIPLGIEKSESIQNAKLFRAFPYADTDRLATTIKKLLPKKTELGRLSVGTVFECNKDGRLTISSCSEPANKKISQAWCGKFLDMAIAKGAQDEFYFNIPSVSEYGIWKKNWLSLTANHQLEYQEFVDSMLETIPPGYLGLPLAKSFARSISLLKAVNHSAYRTCLKVSLDLLQTLEEEEFIGAIGEWLEAQLAERAALVKLESRVALQLIRHQQIPELPRTIDFQTSQKLLKEQIVREFQFPDLVFPRLNKVFEPVKADKTSLYLFQPSKKSVSEPGFIIPVVKACGNAFTVGIYYLTVEEQVLLTVLSNTNGKKSIRELCDLLGWKLNQIQKLCLQVVSQASSIIEFHWLPDLC
jgi:L-ascorbate metabolism protein UlaG (beta-lactamase superfamily)